MRKASASKHTREEIFELLESDDELPDSYDEVPDAPAYQNDLRFERLHTVDFEWLYQKLKKSKTQAEPTSEKPAQLDTCLTNNILKPQPACIEPCLPEPKVGICLKLSTESKKDKKILISRGILTKRDIFFIKCIEEYSTDATLLWFIDFLKSKAEQPRQRSCLVRDITGDHYSVAKEPLSEFGVRYYFRLVNI